MFSLAGKLYYSPTTVFYEYYMLLCLVCVIYSCTATSTTRFLQLWILHGRTKTKQTDKTLCDVCDCRRLAPTKLWTWAAPSLAFDSGPWGELEQIQDAVQAMEAMWLHQVKPKWFKMWSLNYFHLLLLLSVAVLCYSCILIDWQAKETFPVMWTIKLISRSVSCASFIFGLFGNSLHWTWIIKSEWCLTAHFNIIKSSYFVSTYI